VSGALVVTEIAGGVRFGVRVQPRASKPEVAGVHGTALRVRVAAAPVDGAANAAVIDAIAAALGVARRNVVIVSGATSRSKLVEVHGVTRADILALA
jgi:uncharacterized protein (TIGR00251 family)